jgi:hypothetical protein
MFNGIDLTAEQQMLFYDARGSDQTYPHMAVPWAWTFDTPYRWTKQIPSFFGGTRQGMAIAWPGHIKNAGGIRWQFHHVIDVVPTLLEVTGIPAPVMVDGVAQKPIEGVSMAYSFDEANANAPSPHKTQYFEMFGVQALYNDGWMLSAVPTRPPWDIGLGAAITDVANGYKFELYNTKHDWTQNTDLSTKYPDKVRQMRELMIGQFSKYQVLPLDASVITRVVVPRPSLAAGRNVFTYSGIPITGIPGGDAPQLLNTSFTMTAEITVPEGGVEGVINTNGGRFGGYGFYIVKGKPTLTWNLLDVKGEMAEPRGTYSRQPHPRVRLQVRRTGLRHPGIQQRERRRTWWNRDAESRRSEVLLYGCGIRTRTCMQESWGEREEKQESENAVPVHELSSGDRHRNH